MSANQPPENNPQQSGNPQNGPGQAPEQGFPQQQPAGQYGANPGSPTPDAAAQYGAPGAPQYGAPQYGTPQYGPDGQPLQPGAYPPAGGFQPQVAQPAKKGGRWGRILLTVGIAIVVAVISALWRNGVFDSPTMKAGDCVQQTGSDSVKVVDCSSADAQYTVLGIQEKTTQASARLGACSQWPDTDSVYWEGRQTGTGTTYCLQKKA